MKYWTAYNTGYGFITYDDRARFTIAGYPADVWVTDDSAAATEWAARNNAASVTKAEAQALIDALPVGTEPLTGLPLAPVVLP